SPNHSVGTPAAMVTPSASDSSYRLAPSSPGPGIARRQPTIVPMYGMPHALTWNIGTIGHTVSPAPTPSPSGSAAASACSTVERCEYSTPLGWPVVPDV